MCVILRTYSQKKALIEKDYSQVSCEHHIQLNEFIIYIRFSFDNVEPFVFWDLILFISFFFFYLIQLRFYGQNHEKCVCLWCKLALTFYMWICFCREAHLVTQWKKLWLLTTCRWSCFYQIRSGSNLLFFSFCYAAEKIYMTLVMGQTALWSLISADLNVRVWFHIFGASGCTFFTFCSLKPQN